MYLPSFQVKGGINCLFWFFCGVFFILHISVSCKSAKVFSSAAIMNVI